MVRLFVDICVGILQWEVKKNRNCKNNRFWIFELFEYVYGDVAGLGTGRDSELYCAGIVTRRADKLQDW